MALEIKKIQTAIFYKNFQLGNDYDKSKILLELKKEVDHIFDGDPILLPVPLEMPLDIPRIILNSKDGRYSCNISLNRTDIFYNIQKNSDSATILFEVQKNNSLELFNFLKSKNGIINRIGFISYLNFKTEDMNGSGYLGKEFFIKDKFVSPKELMFRYNKSVKTENNFEMNNSITISGINNEKIVNVQLDINTLAEVSDSSDFSKENFDEIVNYSIDKNKSIIDKFPVLV